LNEEKEKQLVANYVYKKMKARETHSGIQFTAVLKLSPRAVRFFFLAEKARKSGTIGGRIKGKNAPKRNQDTKQARG
jgi:hypothetical protein